MLKYFVQIQLNEDGTKKFREETTSYKLFTNPSVGLQIARCKETIRKHLAAYPVISIDFKGIVRSTFEKSLRALRRRVRASFRTYDWLKDRLSKENPRQCRFEILKRVKQKGFLSGSNLTFCFYELSELLFCYFGQRVFVFIDDHDAALNEAFEKEFDFDIRQLHDLIISITSNLLQPKSEYFVAYALITSITQTTANREDYPRTIDHYRFLKSDHLTPFCGFTDDEATSLIDLHKQINFTERNTLRRFYGGYGITYTFLGVCSPHIIKQYLTMSEDEDITSIRQMKQMDYMPSFFKNPLLYKVILHLAFSKSDSVYSNVDWFNVNKMASLIEKTKQFEPPENQNVDVFFWYLLENGYFTYCEKPPVHFRVPNEGIRKEIIDYLMTYYDQEFADGTLVISLILKELFNGDIGANLFEKLKKHLDSYVSKMTAYFHQSTNKQHHYQAVLFYWIKKSFAGSNVDVSISLHDKDITSNVITVQNDGVFLMIQLKCKCKFQDVLDQVQKHNSSLGGRHPKSIHYLAINYKRNFTQIAYCNSTDDSDILVDDYTIPKTTSSITWITKFRKKQSKNRLPWVRYNLGPIDW